MRATLVCVLLMMAVAYTAAMAGEDLEAKDSFAEADLAQRQLNLGCSCNGSSGRPRLQCRTGERVLCRVYRYFRCCGN